MFLKNDQPIHQSYIDGFREGKPIETIPGATVLSSIERKRSLSHPGVSKCIGNSFCRIFFFDTQIFLSYFEAKYSFLSFALPCLHCFLDCPVVWAFN